MNLNHRGETDGSLEPYTRLNIPEGFTFPAALNKS